MYLPEFLLFFCKGKTIREKSVYFLQLKKAINSAEFLTHFVMTVVQIFVQKKICWQVRKKKPMVVSHFWLAEKFYAKISWRFVDYGSLAIFLSDSIWSNL